MDPIGGRNLNLNSNRHFGTEYTEIKDLDKMQREGGDPNEHKMKLMGAILQQGSNPARSPQNNMQGGMQGMPQGGVNQAMNQGINQGMGQTNPNGSYMAMGRGQPTGYQMGGGGGQNPNSQGNMGMGGPGGAPGGGPPFGMNFNQGPPPNPTGGRGITSHQLFQLRAQILAFKYLSRNMALPNKLLAAIRTFSMRSLQHQSAQQQMAQQGGNPNGPHQGNPNSMGNPNNNMGNPNSMGNPNLGNSNNMINPNNMGNPNMGGMSGNQGNNGAITAALPMPHGGQNTGGMQQAANPQQQMRPTPQQIQQHQQYVTAVKSGQIPNTVTPQQFMKMQQGGGSQQVQQGGNVQNQGGQNQGNFQPQTHMNFQGNFPGNNAGGLGGNNGANTNTNMNNNTVPGNGSVSSGVNSNGAPVSNSLSNGMSSGYGSGNAGGPQGPTQPQGAPMDPDQQVLQMIGGKPEALQLAFVLQEREKRIRQRMMKRINELGMIPADAPVEVRRRASIEVKQLRLLEIQKRVRAEVAVRMRKMINIEALGDPHNPRRPKRKEKEHIVREQQVRNDVTSSKLDSEIVRRQKHNELISAVLRHSKDFRDFHTNKQKRQRKIAKDIVNYHTNRQRQLQAEDEKRKRARLEALKNEDEDEYIKFLDEAKHERLSMLIKQTDEYLERIGSLLQSRMGKDDIEEMKAQKNKKKNKKGEEPKEEEKKEEAPATEEQKEEAEAGVEAGTDQAPVSSASQRTKKYYTMAHKIQEQITEQPDMIVGGKLKNYQLQGLQWLVSLYNNKLNGILADEMGLGKTIQTISLIGHLMEKKGDNGPFLVVVPLSTMSNWTLEFGKWAPSVNVVVYKGKPTVRKQIFREEIMNSMFNAVIVSYEYVMSDKSDLSKIEWDYVIVDEGHRIKNRNSKLSNTLRQYMSRHRLLLTGTPLQNDLGELWSLLNFLLPQIFNSSDNFEQWFNAPFAFAQKKGSNIQIQPNEEETLLIIHRLHKVLRPFLLRRLKSDVESELPDKVETVLKCELSAMQKRMYKTMKETKGILLNETNPKGKKKQGFNNTLMQLQKICNHPYLFQDDQYPIDESIVRVSGKFNLIHNILPKLRQTGHRILIFNQMTAIMNIMEDYFGLQGWNYLRLDGMTKADDRAEMVRLWNEPGTQQWLFILSTKAGGLGLNLQTADTVIIFDTDWNPQADLQAQDRAHRIGQKNEVRVFRLVSQNSVEEKILERANFKLDVDAKVIQAGMFNNNANDKMRASMLESLLHEDQDKEEEDVVFSDEQVNALIARSDEEYQLFQQMDTDRNKKEEAEWAAKGLPRPARLITEEELPEYMTQTIDLSDEDITETHGRGRRERPEVTYNLTDPDLDLGSSSSSEDEGKRKRKADSEEDDSDDERPTKRGKGRPPRDPSSGAGAGKKPKVVRPEATAKMEDIWTTVAEAETEGRIPSTAFMKLPSKRKYRDYYQIIDHPISMKNIQDRIKNYRSSAEFRRDFDILFTNARKYNQQGSALHSDANFLQSVFVAEYNRAFDNMPVDETSNSSVHSDKPAQLEEDGSEQDDSEDEMSE